MNLNPLPEIMKDDFDDDSLVYISDDEICYTENFSKIILDDIINKNVQIYSGYYISPTKGTKESPRIFLSGRGKNCGKFKIKIQGFYPYCYIKSDDGEFKDYLGNKVEKIVFKGKEPKCVALFRDIKRKAGFPMPYEADILFVRRMLIDIYDGFKSEEPIKPKIAVLDVETDHPVSDRIISYAINDMENDIIYESKFDTEFPSELSINLMEKLMDYDIITGWNIEFDINILQNDLIEINKLLNYARYNYRYDKKTYLDNLMKSDRIFSERELENILNILIERGYLNEINGIIILGKEFNPLMKQHFAIIDLLPICKKMHAVEIRGKWNLGNVGIQIAGVDKVHIGSKKIRELGEEELQEYNIVDTIIPEIIDNVLGGLDAHIILGWSLQSLIENVIEPAVVNDIALLRAYHREEIVLPSRVYSKEKKKEYKYDAAEPDARPGIYNGLIITDLVHAYPNAVISKNISCETKDPNGENIISYKNKEGIEKIIRFNNKRSIFIETLKEIMNERRKIKTLVNSTPKDSMEYKRLKSIDFALKTQAAAFSHGIFGWSNSRMRDYEIADAITAIVRDLVTIIKEACDVIERSWVYTHTDAVYINAPKNEENNIIEYINEIIKDYSKGSIIMPNLENKGYKLMAYIHSPARNILIPENGSIDNDESWEVTGMNFMRSEVPPPLSKIEIELVKMKMKNMNDDKIKEKLKDLIKELIIIDSRELALIKPLNKPIEEYGRELLDGTHGAYPGHINALLKAREEFDFDVRVGDKFGVLPILTDEIIGKKVKKRKRIDIAFPLEEGLPSVYKIDFENYLRANLWGKIHQLFDMKPRELEKKIMDEDTRKLFGLEEYDKKLKGGDIDV